MFNSANANKPSINKKCEEGWKVKHGKVIKVRLDILTKQLLINDIDVYDM